MSQEYTEDIDTPPLCVSDEEAENTSVSSEEETDGEEDVPSEFLCPLTLEVMEDPVMDRQGINFERSAIVQWLGSGRTTHPLTREPLSFGKLVPNVQLRLKIDHWRRSRGESPEIFDSAYLHSRGGFKESVVLSNGREVEMSFLGLVEAPVDSSMHRMWSEQHTDGEHSASHAHATSEASTPRHHSSHRRHTHRRRTRLTRVLESAMKTLGRRSPVTNTTAVSQQ
eukprot:Nitzschia sp. Nitz4//scaffold108_size72880//63859//64533//NITZ4_005829-RA/size72880-processed-gene-0.86-mRNA-1//1//CDS//3329532711//3847//frame0